MNIRDLSLSNKIRILLYLAVLPLPWLTVAVLEFPLYSGIGASGERFVIAIDGLRSAESHTLLCDWNNCGGPEKGGSALLSAAKSLIEFLFPASIGFLFFAGISLIKGISIKYLKTVKGIILAMLLTGYSFALYGMNRLPDNLPGLILTRGFKTADAVVIYIVVVLVARLVLFKKQSGT
ncbi:MAG: hypothetical protein AMXMBFR48_28960 [Ignavibacteriales bacterium]